MKHIFTLLITLGFINALLAQDVYKYAVHFTDKDNTPYSINEPEAFLSQKAIDRRAKYNISIKENDLPVDPQYIQDVLNAVEGAELVIEVKWLNAIIISLTDTTQISSIHDLPMVAMTKLVYLPDGKSSKDKLAYTIDNIDVYPPLKSTTEYDSAFYGGGWVQISQLKGNILHEMGYTGEGMTIAVLDAGFINVDERTIFNRLWENDQILGTANFVAPGMSVFDDHTHGTSVLSTMGGYWEGYLVGTAPDADYWLIRTEDGASEYLIEEYNWVAGAAFADSVGADVLNTSLGYTEFDDPSMDHTWEELNGDSTVITRGSNIAFSKGMLVVNSAGNSGNDAWTYVGAPADGVDVFSIGAVDENGEIAFFSSHGFPWSDDVKPDVVARGRNAYVASAYSDDVGPSNGTSFSSPIMAGMVTCLWQSQPNLSPFMIKQALYYSSDRFNNPDTLYGYGLPDFEQAMNILGVQDSQESSNLMMVVPNPVLDHFRIVLNQASENLEWKVYNIQGQVVMSGVEEATQKELQLSLGNNPSGIYFVEINQDGQVDQVKISKL
jgi:hypothetical protein